MNEIGVQKKYSKWTTKFFLVYSRSVQLEKKCKLKRWEWKKSTEIYIFFFLNQAVIVLAKASQTHTAHGSVFCRTLAEDELHASCLPGVRRSWPGKRWVARPQSCAGPPANGACQDRDRGVDMLLGSAMRSSSFGACIRKRCVESWPTRASLGSARHSLHVACKFCWCQFVLWFPQGTGSEPLMPRRPLPQQSLP